MLYYKYTKAIANVAYEYKKKLKILNHTYIPITTIFRNKIMWKGLLFKFLARTDDKNDKFLICTYMPR